MSMFWIRNAPRKTPLAVGVAIAAKEAGKVAEEKKKADEAGAVKTGASEGGAADNEGGDDHFVRAGSDGAVKA